MHQHAWVSLLDTWVSLLDACSIHCSFPDSMCVALAACSWSQALHVYKPSHNTSIVYAELI